jgi:hypothetical protein
VPGSYLMRRNMAGNYLSGSRVRWVAAALAALAAGHAAAQPYGYPQDPRSFEGYVPPRVVRCESINSQHDFCRIPIRDIDRVRVLRQFSQQPCMEGRNWNHDERGIWVDGGCRADFAVVTRRPGPGGYVRNDGPPAAPGYRQDDERYGDNGPRDGYGAPGSPDGRSGQPRNDGSDPNDARPGDQGPYGPGPYDPRFNGSSANGSGAYGPGSYAAGSDGPDPDDARPDGPRDRPGNRNGEVTVRDPDAPGDGNDNGDRPDDNDGDMNEHGPDQPDQPGQPQR